MEPSKSPLTSKTLWINLAMAACAFFPVANDFIAANPTVVILAVAGVNFALRLITKGKIELA